MIWLKTAPDLDYSGMSWGQRGWKLHAVRGTAADNFDILRGRTALCGLVPARGWESDLYVETKCTVCERRFLRLRLDYKRIKKPKKSDKRGPKPKIAWIENSADVHG